MRKARGVNFSFIRVSILATKYNYFGFLHRSSFPAGCFSLLPHYILILFTVSCIKIMKFCIPSIQTGKFFGTFIKSQKLLRFVLIVIKKHP